MTINLQKPDIRELKPKITVFGVGGGGGNAVNNMINGGLDGVEFVVANTDAQALAMSKAERVVQLGVDVTQGLGAGSQPSVGSAAAEECLTEIQDHLSGTHMCFVTAGMGGGTGTGAAPVVARAARELGILTVGVVTKPFQFEGGRRMKTAEDGIIELQKNVDTLIVIPNQNLFRIANDKTTFADAFGMADQVLYSGVACITDLMVKEGLINLDFADVRSVMREMGKAMMGTGESSGEGRALQAAEAAISNPLLDETSMRGAQGLLISITGGKDMTLFEVDEAATRIREEIDADANIIVGATFDESLEGIFRVSVVATGIENSAGLAEPVMQPRRMEAVARETQKAETPETAQPEARASILSPRSSDVEKALDLPSETPAAATRSTATTHNGVRLDNLRMKTEVREADLDDDFSAVLEEELAPEIDGFIPDAPQKPAKATAQTPSRVAPTQETAPIQRAEHPAPLAPASASLPEHQREGSPLSLLQKLKSGFGVRESHHEPAKRVEPQGERHAETAPAKPTPEISRQRPVSMEEARENPYAPRNSGVDRTGRQTPATARALNEDEQLDIPAFLRRQAN